ncbi:MAG: hypothetical protein CL862_00065 [Cyanobium sp. NAT70]|nr:hypothetical protein [Cyanobium sp. NAT70]
MRNLIGDSKSYDRHSKIFEAIRAHNCQLSSDSRCKKFGKMLISPYIFYRGTNHLFWADFAGSWRLHHFGGAAWSRSWLQGDSHVYNMGAFMHQGESVCFGFDDFDDSLVADYQYDVWRFSVSIVLDCWDRGLTDQSLIDQTIDIFSQSYIKSFKEVVDAGVLFSKRFTLNNTCKPLAKFLKKAEKKGCRQRMLEKWTSGDGHHRRFSLDSGKILPLGDHRRDQLTEALMNYRERRDQASGLTSTSGSMKILDVAERIGAGTGSLGNQRYYALIRDFNSEGKQNELILDIKLQGHPTAYEFLSREEIDEYNSNFLSHAARHADAYVALSDFPDHHLGWLTLDDGSYSIRERCPYKRDFDTQTLSSKGLLLMARQWGEILALKHRRAARRLVQDQHSSSFELELGKIANSSVDEFSALVRFIARPYADQVRRDWDAFRLQVDALMI